MKKFELLAASALVMVVAIPANAQTGATTSAENTAPTNGPGQEAVTGQTDGQQVAQLGVGDIRGHLAHRRRFDQVTVARRADDLSHGDGYSKN